MLQCPESEAENKQYKQKRKLGVDYPNPQNMKRG